MYSYQSFKPGGNKNIQRMIKYVALYNTTNPTNYLNTCYCIPNKYDKNTPGSDNPSITLSYARRISQIIQTTKGGKTQYGNFYLGEPLNINYLGRIEGMSGGGGSPPKNKF